MFIMIYLISNDKKITTVQLSHCCLVMNDVIRIVNLKTVPSFYITADFAISFAWVICRSSFGHLIKTRTSIRSIVVQ